MEHHDTSCRSCSSIAELPWRRAPLNSCEAGTERANVTLRFTVPEAESGDIAVGYLGKSMQNSDTKDLEINGMRVTA